MRILAVHPLYPANAEIIYLPLGLATICAVAEREGHEVRVLDMHNLRIPHAVLEKELRKREYDICLMGGFALQVQEMKAVTKIVKDLQPYCQVILGGVGVNTIPEIALHYTGADAVSNGEAEITFAQLLSSFEEGCGYEKALGFVYRQGGRIVNQPKGPVPQNLDEVPWPSYHLFDIEHISRHSYNGRNGRSIHIMTSRGCPFRCDFCINSILNSRSILKEIHGEIVEESLSKGQRFRSTDQLVQEIQHLRSEYGIQDFHFADEEFITHRRRLEEVCAAVEPLGITWSTSGRADWATEDKLERMKKAGCHYVIFGVESGSQKMLDLMEKNAKKEAVAKGLRAARKVGMNFIANFMIGYPGESEGTVRESIEFCKDHHLIYLPSYVTLFPNSKMFHQVYRDIDDWNHYFDRLSRIDYSKNYFYNLTDLPREKIVALRTRGVAETLSAALFPKLPRTLQEVMVQVFGLALTVLDRMPGWARRAFRNTFRYFFEFVWLKEKARKSGLGEKTSRQIASDSIGQEMPDMGPDAYEESLRDLERKEKLPAKSQWSLSTGSPP